MYFNSKSSIAQLIKYCYVHTCTYILKYIRTYIYNMYAYLHIHTFIYIKHANIHTYTRGKQVSEKTSFQVWNGPVKRTETRQGWENSRTLPYYEMMAASSLASNSSSTCISSSRSFFPLVSVFFFWRAFLDQLSNRRQKHSSLETRQSVLYSHLRT